MTLGALAATAALTGCGTAATSSDVRPAHATTPAFLSGPELERQLAAGFRDGLGRLAVMAQPADGAADLGQDLPQGSMRAVSCHQSSPQPAAGASWAWSCSVSWRTARGTAQSTQYSARLSGARCFVAQATPALSDVHDATIQTYAEHPLNRLYSVARGC